MREARFQLTCPVAGHPDQEDRPRQRPRKPGASVWLAAMAAGLYWLSGAGHGRLWPIQISPVPVLTPSRLDFGSQPVGAPATTRQARLLVTGGTQAFDVHTVTLSDPESRDFTVTEDGCSAARLRAGETCSIGLSFEATRQGTHSALLLVGSTNGSRPLEVVLTGIAEPPPDKISASLPETLDFDQVRVGSTATRSLGLDVTSTGTMPLVVGAAWLSDSESTPFKIAHDGCADVQLLAGQSCALTLLFEPGQVGEQIGLLSVPTSLGSQPLKTELRGTATPRPKVAGRVPQINDQTDLPVHTHPPGATVAEAVPIYDPEPVYPEAAAKAGTQGLVLLSAVIGRDGSVRSVKAVSGEPTLAAAAVRAVSAWRYRPTELDGKPVDDDLQIVVKFTLTPAAMTPAGAQSTVEGSKP
ncbi:MAG TPA: TonB family protein [Terriglobia bacterium]|nr:TonB family protein [Terriglobia bacterium]